MQIIVTLNDVIIDPAKPMDLSAMEEEMAIELLPHDSDPTPCPSPTTIAR